jgi:hypothetical protein
MKLQGEIARYFGIGSGGRLKKLSLWLLFLSTLPCVVSLRAAVGQNTTVNAGDITAMPGDMAAVPISIVLPSGTQCTTLQFKLTVTGNGGAPAVTTKVAFASLIGPPSQIFNPSGHPEQVLVGWFFLNFPPTGTTQVGTLRVAIPATAQSGQTYTVQVLLPSGTTDGSTELPMNGVNGTITIVGLTGPTSTATPNVTDTNTPEATPTQTPTPTFTLSPTPTPSPTSTPTPTPTPISFVVCDVVPSSGDDAGQFGDGKLKNNDVVAIFNASLQTGVVPAGGTARFSAMDSATVDTPPTCGGDTKLKNNDVVACFNRSLGNGDNEERTISGSTCTSISVPQ